MQPSAEKIWQSAQQLLRGLLNTDIYNLWFASLRARDLDGDFLTLEVANDFCELWLKDNYLGLLRDVLTQSSGQAIDIRFCVVAPPVALPGPGLSAAGETPAAHEEPPETFERHGTPRDVHFNPRNTFDTFVVGNNNTFAHAAAMAVAQAPGRSYNPLFVYGGVGLGKTHLLHAIGQYVTSHKKGARVTYVSSEKFTNEFIEAIQNNQLVKFRRRFHPVARSNPNSRMRS